MGGVVPAGPIAVEFELGELNDAALRVNQGKAQSARLQAPEDAVPGGPRMSSALDPPDRGHRQATTGGQLALTQADMGPDRAKNGGGRPQLDASPDSYGGLLD
jgi:hypothetical protein